MMSEPKHGRTRASLSPEDLKDLEDREAAVVWKPFVSFDREPGDDPKDHGDQPYEPGPSLMDRERRGSFTVEHNDAWLGGIVIHASDGTNMVSLMLDRAQVVERLIEGLHHWDYGTLANWNEES